MATRQLAATTLRQPRLRLPGVPVFLYHGVAHSALPKVSLRERKYWIAKSHFHDHLNQIRSAGYQGLLLREVWNHPDGLNGHDPRVVLTFDDGLASAWEVAFPLLLEAGARADFFLNVKTIGMEGFLSWPQIAEMQRAGMSFQSHGFDHVDLAWVPTPALEWQLRESKRRLEDGLGCSVDFLAAPYGRVNRRVLEIAEQEGYRAVCTSRSWPARPGMRTVNRIPVYRHTSSSEFSRLLRRIPTSYAARALRPMLVYLPKRLLLSSLGRPDPGGLPMRPRRRLHLFVLIDGLGWRLLEDHEFLSDLLPYRAPLRTVLGYSSGAIPTILTGRPPSEHGQWNLVYYDPQNSPFRWLRFFRFLPDALLDNRATRKLVKELGRRILGLGPLFECCVSPRLLPWFNWVEKRNIYDRNGISGTRSVFDRLAEAGISYHVYSYHRWNDAEIFRKARRDLDAGEATFFFLYLSELDRSLHNHCNDVSRVEERLAWYAAELRALFETARKIDSEASFTVFSDHGMTPVRHHFDLAQTVEALGLTMPADYLAVYDSTMARFWFFNDRARRQVLQRLQALRCGRIVPDDELRELGILFPDRRYGEVVFLLHPGWLVAASNFNGRGWTPAGMHGYHPDDPHSDAIFLSDRKPAVPVRTIADVYMCVSRHATSP